MGSKAWSSCQASSIWNIGWPAPEAYAQALMHTLASQQAKAAGAGRQAGGLGRSHGVLRAGPRPSGATKSAATRRPDQPVLVEAIALPGPGEPGALAALDLVQALLRGDGQRWSITGCW